MQINIPAVVSIRVQARNENSPVAEIATDKIGPDLAAAVFDYGLRQIIRDAAANGTEKAIEAAMERAKAISAGNDWRSRATGGTTDSLTAECRAIATKAVKAAKPQGMKMADWLADARVKAKIEEIMARDTTIAQARQIIALRGNAAPVDLDNL